MFKFYDSGFTNAGKKCLRRVYNSKLKRGFLQMTLTIVLPYCLILPQSHLQNDFLVAIYAAT